MFSDKASSPEKEEQPSKADLPKLVTLLGISSEPVKLLQFLNALSPIVVIVLGIDSSPEKARQFLNAALAIEVTLYSTPFFITFDGISKAVLDAGGLEHFTEQLLPSVTVNVNV